MKRRTMLGVCALLAACSPAVRNNNTVSTSNNNVQTVTPPPPKPPQTEAMIVEQRSEGNPTITLRVVFRAGSAHDPKGKEGSAFLAARWMREGGTESMTFEEFQRATFPMAAHVSVSVEREMTVFEAQVHKDWIEKFYPLFRDLILHPRLDNESFARVKTQTSSELTNELRNANDEELGKEVLQSLIYQDHPYGHPPVGTEAGLTAADADSVKAFRTAYFTSNRVIVGLAGGYDPSLVERVRADMNSLPKGSLDEPVLNNPTRPDGIHVVVVNKPTARATAVSMGFPLGITRKDPEFADVQFVTHYLGLHRQSSGVLFQTIRESRGLNYGDYAYAEYFEEAPGTRFPRANVQRRQQFASLWLRPLAPNKAHFAIRAALRALDTTLSKGIPEDAFARNQQFLSGYVSLYAQDQSERLGYAIDDAWNDIDSSARYAERLRAAWGAQTREQILARAQLHLTARNLWIAIIAPNARELADAIGSNAASEITYDTPKPADVMTEDTEIAKYPLPVEAANVQVVELDSLFKE